MKCQYATPNWSWFQKLNLFLVSQPIYGNDDFFFIYTSQDENSYSVVVH